MNQIKIKGFIEMRDYRYPQPKGIPAPLLPFIPRVPQKWQNESIHSIAMDPDEDLYIEDHCVALLPHDPSRARLLSSLTVSSAFMNIVASH